MRYKRNKEIEELLKSIPKDTLEKILDDYSDFLHSWGYIDSDYYTEEPHAVDRYVSNDKI